MVRYFMELSYDGAPFCGWQIQPDAPSVQQELEDKLSIILRTKTPVVGCGRTDTGVHASQYFAHFEGEFTMPEEVLAFKLNCMLPAEVAIHRVFEVAQDTHARFSAEARTYHYFISPSKNAFAHTHSWYMHQPLDVAKMNEACHYLLGEQDFTSFSKLHTQVNHNFCTITFAQWEEVNGQLKFTITANRFLRNMVRAIVGTLIEVGRGKIEPSDLQQIITQKSRQKAGASVPGHGLFLAKIEYPMLS